MYRLFIKPPSAHFTGIATPNMPRLRGLVADHFDYQLQLNDINGFVIPGNHFLIKLALNLLSYTNENLNTFQIVRNSLQSIASVNKLTSNLTFGTTFENVLYTNYSIVYAVSEATELDCRDWMDYVSVKVIEHPMTDMDIFMPTVMDKDQVDGLTVIEIDLPMLAYQLKKWLKSDTELNLTPHENLNFFYSKFILPKVIPSYLDLALRNRIKLINSNTVITHQRRERSWAISYEDTFGKNIKNTLDTIKDTRMPYFRILDSIPLVYEKSFYSLLPFEIGEISSYSYWAMFYTFTQYFHSVIDLVNVEQTENTDLAKNLIRVNRLLNSGFLVTRFMPGEIKDKLFDQYREIQDKFLK